MKFKEFERKNLFDIPPKFEEGDIVKIDDKFKIKHIHLLNPEGYAYIYYFIKDEKNNINTYTLRPIEFPDGGMGVFVDEKDREYIEEDYLTKVDEKTGKELKKKYPKNITRY